MSGKLMSVQLHLLYCHLRWQAGWVAHASELSPQVQYNKIWAFLGLWEQLKFWELKLQTKKN